MYTVVKECLALFKVHLELWMMSAHYRLHEKPSQRLRLYFSNHLIIFVFKKIIKKRIIIGPNY